MGKVVLKDTTLQAIGNAIREKTGSTETMYPSEMAAAIRGIATGGGGAATEEPLDPAEVYKATRPADWLPMPEPVDNEMYLLFHIPNGASALLAFTVTATGGYTVALGTVTDGVYVAQSSQSVASGALYSAELKAEDYGDLTASGFKQVMVKVSGTITKFALSNHPKKSNCYNWNIVEFKGKLPSVANLKLGSSNANYALTKLRYFSLIGSNAITSGSGMLQNCSSLVAVLELDASKFTITESMFRGCGALVALPPLTLASIVTNASYMFRRCEAIRVIPPITGSLRNTQGMFWDCAALILAPAIGIDPTSLDSTYYNCYSLTAILGLSTRWVISMGTAFYQCFSLQRLTLCSDVTGWSGCNIALNHACMGHEAIVELFESLPAITATKDITLTGNPGVSELTEEEKAIATGKGWTLTL